MRSNQALTVLSVWARVIVTDLRRHGRNVEAALDEVDLNLRVVNREGGRIPWEAQAKLMDIAARELADDCYGLHLASKVDVRDVGVIAYIGVASRTFGDALANLARYVQVFNEALRFDLSTEDGATIIGIMAADPSLLHYRQQMEFGIGLLLNAYRFFTKQQVTPAEVRFRACSPGQAARGGALLRVQGQLPVEPARTRAQGGRHGDPDPDRGS